MIFLKDKLLIILTQIMISVIDVANLFIADIIIYETTSGFSFDYGALLHNLLFWVLLSNETNPNPKPIGEGFGFVVYFDYPNFNLKNKK